MGFDPEQLARELWAIGDVNRLRILALLPNCEACEGATNVSEIADQLGLSQPTVSNHLARLRTLGIVRCQRRARDVYYWIDPGTATQIIDDLNVALKR